MAGLGFVLHGCGGTISRGADIQGPAYHTVQRGDTLYSIAWEAGQDYREVARWNGIRSPYLIKPGQRLRLTPPGQAANDSWVVKRGDTLYHISRESGVPVRELARLNRLRAPYTIVPGQRIMLGDAHDKKIATNSSRSRHAPMGNDAAPPPGKVNIAWTWPVKGELLSRFDTREGAKGLDIGARRGTPVRAAAPGTVVYQGSGLRGYGKLIIIKHDSDFLSAYAHVDSIYVQEGNVIKGAQKIADMGSTGTNRVMLHFEIRYRGVPVDPLKYLPKT